MTAREQAAFKPSLAKVFAQHFHDVAVRTQFIFDRNNLYNRAPLPIKFRPVLLPPSTPQSDSSLVSR